MSPMRMRSCLRGAQTETGRCAGTRRGGPARIRRAGGLGTGAGRALGAQVDSAARGTAAVATLGATLPSPASRLCRNRRCLGRPGLARPAARNGRKLDGDYGPNHPHPVRHLERRTTRDAKPVDGPNALRMRDAPARNKRTAANQAHASICSAEGSCVARVAAYLESVSNS